MVRWHQRTTVECPRHGAAPEDKPHIILCSQQDATDLLTLAISSLKKWLQEEEMDLLLITNLLTSLQEWHSGVTISGTLPLTRQQSLIGWEAVMDRWLGLEWHAHQEAYWNLWKHWKSSRRWAMELI